MTKVSEEKQQLIEELGLNLEEQIKVAPLAARIYALLVLSPQEGLTFDEIKEAIQASKSSVSTNLKVLTQLRYVEFYTKSGIRKRYFKVAKYFQLLSLEREVESLENQLEMIKKINAFNEAHYPEKKINDQSLGSIMQTYLETYRALVKKTIDEIKTYRKQDKIG